MVDSIFEISFLAFKSSDQIHIFHVGDGDKMIKSLQDQGPS